MKRLIVSVTLCIIMIMADGCVFSSDDTRKKNEGAIQGTVSMILTGEPLAGVKVWLVDTRVEADLVNYDHNRRAVVDSTITDASGKYVFTSVAPGKYGVAPVFEDTSAVYQFAVRQDGDPNEFSLNGETRTVNFTAERKDVPGADWFTCTITILLENYTGKGEWVTVAQRFWILFFPFWEASRSVKIQNMPYRPIIEFVEDLGIATVFYTRDNVFQISGPVNFQVGVSGFDGVTVQHYSYDCNTGVVTHIEDK